MSKTSIEWCARPGTLPEVWNVVTGCNKVSQGCKNCYAEVMHKRLQFMYPKKYDHDFLSGAHIHEDLLTLPFTWKKPRTVFVNSMSDLFHANVGFNFLYKVYEKMLLTPQHTYIIVTKRAERLYLVNDISFHLKRNYPDNIFPLPNVWHLVSTEDQAAADQRIPLLLQIPSAVYGISAEPLLGKIDLFDIPLKESPGASSTRYLNKLNWIICGGESGHHARPMHPDWVRSLRDQSKAAGVAFFFKQWGEWIAISQWSEEQLKEFDDTDKLHDQNRINLELDPYQTLCKLGKKKSGRILDQVEWNQFPKN